MGVKCPERLLGWLGVAHLFQLSPSGPSPGLEEWLGGSGPALLLCDLGLLPFLKLPPSLDRMRLSSLDLQELFQIPHLLFCD